MPGRHEAVHVRFGQIVAFCNLAPDRSILGHLLFERLYGAIEGGGFQLEPGGNAAPHPLPAEDIAIDDVEFAVGCTRCRGSPEEMAGEKVGAGHVGQPLPLHLDAREAEGAAGVLADGSVDGKRRAHVHGIADSLADNRMRAMDAPGKAVAGGCRKHFVFLGVVEIIDLEPALFLAERRLRQGALAVVFEWAEVMLEARHQRHMLDGACRRQRVEDIAHHRRVDADVFGFRRLPQPARDEHMRGIKTRQRFFKRGRIEKIRGHRCHVRLLLRCARQAENLPAVVAQNLCCCAADNAACAHDQCFFRHNCSCRSDGDLVSCGRLCQKAPEWDIGTLT